MTTKCNMQSGLEKKNSCEGHYWESGAVCCCCCCLVIKSWPTLCNPMDYSPPSFSVHRILQARILGWVAVPFSGWSSQPRDWTWVSCLPHWQVDSLPLAPPGDNMRYLFSCFWLTSLCMTGSRSLWVILKTVDVRWTWKMENTRNGRWWCSKAKIASWTTPPSLHSEPRKRPGGSGIMVPDVPVSESILPRPWLASEWASPQPRSHRRTSELNKSDSSGLRSKRCKEMLQMFPDFLMPPCVLMARIDFLAPSRILFVSHDPDGSRRVDVLSTTR